MTISRHLALLRCDPPFDLNRICRPRHTRLCKGGTVESSRCRRCPGECTTRTHRSCLTYLRPASQTLLGVRGDVIVRLWRPRSRSLALRRPVPPRAWRPLWRRLNLLAPLQLSAHAPLLPRLRVRVEPIKRRGRPVPISLRRLARPATTLPLPACTQGTHAYSRYVGRFRGTYLPHAKTR
eukprot:3731285-Pleurochrysis_carterae.AAC.1